MEADLAIARAYSGSSERLVGESAQSESTLKIELDILRQRLSEKEAQVVSGEERLSRLEAVHRVAQVHMHSRLEAVHHVAQSTSYISKHTIALLQGSTAAHPCIKTVKFEARQYALVLEKLSSIKAP